MQSWLFNETTFRRCMCDGQYDDHGSTQNLVHAQAEHIGKICREATISYFRFMGQIYCPDWTHERVQYYEWYDTLPAQKLTEILLKDPSKKNIIFHAVGLHIRLNSATAIRQLYQPVLNIINNTRRNTHYMIGSVHMPGSNKPPQYLKTQGPEAVKTYNRAVQDWARMQNITFYYTERLTANVTSIDGTHFGLRVNIILAQMLLNAIRQLL